MILPPSSTRLMRLLQAVFIQQARYVIANTQLTLDGDVKTPDMTHWAQVTADVVMPVILLQWQAGMLRTAARLSRAGSLPARSSGGVHLTVPPSPPASILSTQGTTPPQYPVSPLLTDEDMRQYRLGNDYYLTRKSLGISRVPRFVRYKAVNPKTKMEVRQTFDLFNPRVLDAVDQAVMVFCRDTMETATTKLEDAVSSLRSLLKEGLPRGDAQSRLARDIRNIFADPQRAFRIAVTEAPRALYGGQLMATKESGVVTKKVWLASSDACERCLDLDGEDRDLDQPFLVDQGGGPYAVVQHPPLHPRCLCSMTEGY